MLFFIKDNKLQEKYNKIGDKFSKAIKKYLIVILYTTKNIQKLK